jgi:hypothetical protein
MIGSACETTEEVTVKCHKGYGLRTRQGTNLGPTLLDNAQAAKIQEQEGLLRTKLNYGEGGRRSPFTSILCYNFSTYSFTIII